MLGTFRSNVTVGIAVLAGIAGLSYALAAPAAQPAGTTAAAGAFLLAQDQPAASWALHSREKPATEVASSGISSGPVSTCHSQ